MIGTPKPICRHPLENTVTVTLRPGLGAVYKPYIYNHIYVYKIDYVNIFNNWLKNNFVILQNSSAKKTMLSGIQIQFERH